MTGQAVCSVAYMDLFECFRSFDGSKLRSSAVDEIRICLPALVFVYLSV